MNNTLHYIEEYKTFEWQLNDYLGNIFEREIFQIINKQISGKFDDGVRIYQTPTGPDGGKDIIIRSTVPVCILNQSFELDFKDEITIYIECKSSDKKRIDLTKVAGSLMRVKENNIDYYVLISNSSFAPQTLHILKTDFEAAGIKFKVIDQYFLLKALENESFFNSKSIIVENKLYYEYQVSTTRVDNKNAYELFFTYRNLENEDQLITQKLLTDNNWSVDSNERKFFVKAHSMYVNKIRVEGIYKKRIEYLKRNEFEAENLIEYFYILSILQDRQSKDMALKCLSEEKLNFLIQRRFLNYSENGEVIFSHESFAIYIRHSLEKDAKLKKKLANSFFAELNYLLEYVTMPEKGVLALWAGKNDLAKECFSGLTIISTFTNALINAATIITIIIQHQKNTELFCFPNALNNTAPLRPKNRLPITHKHVNKNKLIVSIIFNVLLIFLFLITIFPVVNNAPQIPNIIEIT